MSAGTTTTSAKDFLQQQAAKWQNQKPISHFVVGNEAGDADSLISALTWAYVCQSQDVVVPVLSIPRSDVSTQRPETRLLLELAGLWDETENLLSNVPDITDLLEGRLFFDESSLLVTLVDHNVLSSAVASALSPTVGQLSWKVVEILDHHLDLGSYHDTVPPNKRNVAFGSSAALVASTCTLVVERWFQQKESIPLDASAALLLLGTILLDSVNLDPKAGKVTDRDRVAVEQLLDHIVALVNSQNDPLPKKTLQLIGMERGMSRDNSNQNDNKKCLNTTALFEALQQAKFDRDFWRSLSVRDALRLDYKQFEIKSDEETVKPLVAMFGASTVLLSFSDFASSSPPDILRQNILEYMKEKNVVDLLAIMLTSSSTSSPPVLQRELILCNASPRTHQEFLTLVQHLKATTEPVALGLKELEIHSLLPTDDSGTANASSPLTIKVFRQGNAKASRKQVAPILIGLLERLPTLAPFSGL